MIATASEIPSPKLRVMHVLLSMGVGGAEKLVYDMVCHTDATKIDVSVCCIQDRGILADNLRERGIPVFTYQRKDGLDWSLVRWLKLLVKNKKIVCIHAHQYSPMFYSVLAVAGLMHVRVIYTEHGRLFPDTLNWKRFIINPLLALGIQHIVSIAESTKQAMVRFDNFPPRKIKVIHNGVQLTAPQAQANLSAKRRSFGLEEHDLIVGTAARLEDIKNLPMMLRALKRVLKNKANVQLLIAGHGPKEQALKTLAEELGIVKNVVFLGLRFDLAEIYPIFDVFLLSSLTEGISITLLEAMAQGLPVVATDVGGNNEVVDNGQTGFLVKSDDDAEMAEKILFLLNSPAYATQMGVKGKARVTGNFSFQNMLNKYNDLYNL